MARYKNSVSFPFSGVNFQVPQSSSRILLLGLEQSPDEMLSNLVVLASAAGIAVQSVVAAAAASVGPHPGQIKNLVTFGDSYTDVVSTNSPPKVG